MSLSQREELQARLARAREELAQAEAAMPAHSARPWQFQRLEDAEEAVAELEEQLRRLS